ncbi:MAG: hypothetical protein LUD72_07460 [Bacteroidales bacterium]|nr:hypothetical protein [Bacteroidales bacterium]
MSKFSELPVKDKVIYTTTVVMMVFGIALTVAGFIVEPLGEVSNSVLWVLGQSLLYCAAALGITSYYDGKLRDFQDEVRKRLNEKIAQKSE